MSVMTAVIPVAGAGTRLLPATKSQPKEMLPVGRKPVVRYVVEEMGAAGIDSIVFVTGRGKTSIENHFDRDVELELILSENGRDDPLFDLECSQADFHFYYTRQRERRGTGDAVRCARDFTAKVPFVVAFGDSIIAGNRESPIVKRIIHCFNEHDPVAVIAFREVPTEQVANYGVAEPKDEGDIFELEDLVEKPSPGSAPSNLAIVPRYVFSPDIYEAIDRTEPTDTGEVQLTDAIRMLIREGRKVFGVKLAPGEKRYDIGNFLSYFRTFIDFALADEEYGDSVRKYMKDALGQS